MNHEDSEVGDPVQEAWQAAMSHIDLHYSVKDRAIIMSATTAEEVIAHIEALHVRSKAYPKIQLLEKAKPFIENLQEYSKILGAFSNANMAVSLIWGSTKLVLVIWGGLLWGKFHGESTRIIADMNRHREQIDLEMNANNIIEAKTARREERANRELFAYLEVIKWLNPSEIEHQLDDLLRDKEEGTCMWFFQDPTVNSWIKGVVSLLWINGIPG
ncbi:hypothetical protein J1614_010916 [Plenodomus biglobosus]|nr:hypothetical protein J1614_010916 [Plenodomus biglobosus]